MKEKNLYYFHKKPKKTNFSGFFGEFFLVFLGGFFIANPAIRRIVKGDPRFKSYARRRTQFLSEVMTKSRAKKLDRSSVDKAKKLDKSSVDKAKKLDKSSVDKAKKLDKSSLAKVCRRSPTRIKAVVEANGHFTE